MIEKLEKILKIIIALLFLFFVCITFTQVVLRYGFSSSIAWIDEVARYAFIWLVFLAAAVLARHGAHVSIDIIGELVGPKLGRAMLVVADLALIAFAGVVGLGGWRLMQVNWMTVAPASGIPVAWIQAILPMFGFLLAVFATCHLIDVLRGKTQDTDRN